MSHSWAKVTATILLVALNLAFPPSPPRAAADNTRAVTVGAQVMNTASDILGAIDPGEETLKRFGTGLGSAVLGIAIGEAISDVYNGDVTKGLETFTWAAGETAVGLTAMGPFYALGKLATAGSGWALEQFYAYMTDEYYTKYKELRTSSLWPLVEQPQRDQFVAWAKGGRSTFDGQWSVMWADKFARDRFIDQYRDAYRSRFSLTERTIGFRLFSAGSQRAQQYFQVMNEVPDQSAVKEFIYRRWEAQLVTEALQEAATRIRTLQNERNKGIFVVLTGSVRDAEGQAIPPHQVAVTAPGGTAVFSDMGALTPAALQGAGRFALGGNLAYLSSLDAQTELTLSAGGNVVSRFTVGSVLKPSVPVVREAGVGYLVIDLGALQAQAGRTTIKLAPSLRGAPVDRVQVQSLDAQVTRISAVDTTALSFDLQAAAGKTVKLVLEVWDAAVSANRSAVVEVTVPPQPGEVPVAVDIPVPEMREAAGDDAAVAALNTNYSLLVSGQITRAVYNSARNSLVSAHPALSNLADQYDTQIGALADQELQYLRVQAEYYTAKSDDLKAKAYKVADGVTNPLYALSGTESLAYRRESVAKYNQARSAYASMLEQAAQYQQALESLQAEYNQALAGSQQHYELYKDGLRGFALHQFPPEVNRFAANAGEIARLLQPYLRERDTGYLAQCDKQAERHQTTTEWLQLRAAALKERIDASRSRIAADQSAAASILTQRKGYAEKGLFDLTRGIGSLYETMNGILAEEQKLKAGQEANTEWLNHYKNRLPEFYGRASQMLEQMVPILGAQHKSPFPADSFEGFMDRLQPWLAFEERVYSDLAGAIATNLALVEASSATGNYAGLDFAITGDDAWTDWLNAVPAGQSELYQQEGRTFQQLLGQALDGIGDPAADARMLERWLQYLKENGYQLKTAPAEANQPGGGDLPAAPSGDPNVGPGKITFQVDSNIAWVNGRRVELAAPVPMVGGRTLVPVRLIGEALGATVVWNAEYQEVMYLKGSLTVALRVGDTLVRVDDLTRSNRFFIDPVPQIIEGRTYVPVRVVSEALGATVQWIDQTRQVVILIP